MIVGGVRSITSERELLDELTFPALSAVVAVMECPPSLNVPVLKLNVPPTSTVAWPSVVNPSKTVTTVPASAVPDRVGVSSFVGLLPLIVGVAGATVSIKTENPLLAALTFPALSVALAVSE